MIAAALEAEVEPPFDVYAENWDAVQLFRSLQTQWRVIAGFGGATYQGIDYAAIGAVLSVLTRRAQRAEMFACLQLMEGAAIPILNARDKSDA